MTQDFTEEELFESIKAQMLAGEMTQEQAEQAIYAFRNQVTPEEAITATMPEGNIVSGARELTTAVAGGIAGQIAAGYRGLGALVPGGQTPSEAISETQSWFAERSAPETQAGVQAVETLGELMEKGIDLANIPLSGLAGIAELITGQGLDQAVETIRNVQENGFSQTVGDRVFEETNSPLMATAAYASPEILGSVIPVSRMVRARNDFQLRVGEQIRNAEANPQLASQLAETSTALRAGENVADLPVALRDLADTSATRFANQLKGIANDVESGIPPQSIANQLDDVAKEASRTSADKSLVQYIQDGAGRAKVDPVAVEAVKQGFDDAVIASVKAATPEDRNSMRQMVEIMERTKRDARYAVDNRPSDIAGQSLINRVNHVKKVNTDAGKELEEVAKGLKGQQVDFDDAIDGFLSRLDDMGVTLDENLNPRFLGSDIEGIAPAEGIITKIVNRLKSGKAPDAYDVHKMKKFIDEQVTYGKVGEGLTGEAERAIKALRADLDNALDSTFPDYNRVNTTYADTIAALDSLQSAAGTKIDLFGPNADKAMGTVLRRLMSNTQGRVGLMDSVDEIETIARRYGGQFNDDVATQILFADELDSVFGPVARTSFQRSVGEGVRQGVEMATGQKTGLGMVAEAAGKAADRLQGVNEENAFLVIKELLERQ